MTSDSVKTVIDGAIGYILLDRPEKRNAMSSAMWRAVPIALKEQEDTPDVRVVVVKSTSKKAFSAGADIAELGQIAVDVEKRERNRQAIREAQRALARSKKPTIAQINGACVGGGCGLAIHTDFRFAGMSARFGITPARLGIVYPQNDTKELIDLVGLSAAKRLLYTGALISAEEAKKIGLVDHLCPDEALEMSVRQFAEQFCHVSLSSIRGIKQVIRAIQDGATDDDEASIRLFLEAHECEDAQEGIGAFLAKRKPNFKG